MPFTWAVISLPLENLIDRTLRVDAGGMTEVQSCQSFDPLNNFTLE